MKNPANFPQRHSIRLPGYDYSQPGEYFITLVTYQRQHLFGEITNGTMFLNPLGQIAAEEWFETAQLRPYVELSADEFVVMPNHIHGILHINANGTAPGKALRRNAPTQGTAPAIPPAPHSLAAVVRAYKSAVTYAIHSLNDSRGLAVWQRNYYEIIIRSEKETRRIQAYIKNNPAHWVADREKGNIII